MKISKAQKEAIITEMINVLEERNYTYNYTKEALNDIVRKWFKAKAPLIELLSRHPNWNPDKFMIQFDSDYNRRFNTKAIADFLDWVLAYEVHPWKECIHFILSLDRQFFDSTMDEKISRINSLNPEYRIKNNMKTSKVIGRIARIEGWDKYPNFNKKYSELCDNINPIKVTRHTCISLNPIDFLLMSNGNDWTSCHRIGYLYASGKIEPGAYASGTISYMLDNVSFVFYTVSSDYAGNAIELEPKYLRQIFAYQDKKLFQSRLYPQANDCGAEAIYTDIRNIVQKVVADCLGELNQWKLRKDTYPYVVKTKTATCYPDWAPGARGYHLCTISFLGEPSESDIMNIGATPVGINTGRAHYTTECITGNGYWWKCEGCGSLHTGVAHHLYGKRYCDNCVFLCDECCCYHLKKEMHYALVKTPHIPYGNRARFVWCCDSCLATFADSGRLISVDVNEEEIEHIEEE